MLPDAPRGAAWLTGQHTPLAWEMVVCMEPGKQGGVEVSHLQEQVHSFVTRLKLHMAFMNLELLFLALVPTISPVLETQLAGTAQITSITAKHEKSCKKIYHLAYVVLPKRWHKEDNTNLRDKTRLAGPCSLLIQDNVLSSVGFASLGSCTEAGTLPSHSRNASFHFIELHNSICSGGSKGQWGRAPVERRASSSH